MASRNSSALLTALLILCQVLVNQQVRSDGSVKKCDFASKSQLLKDGGILFCHRVFTEGTIMEITCPREVSGVPYSFYPEDAANVALLPSHSFGKRQSTDFRLEQWPLSQIFGRLSNQPLAYWRDETKKTLVIKYPEDGYLVRRHFSDITYLCKPTDLELTLASIAELSRFSRMHFYGDRTEDGTMVVADKLNLSDLHSIAVFELKISNIPKVTHGCGSVPSNLFLNKAYNDPIDPLDTCTIDLMETPNMGFYCDGKVEPEGCFDEVADAMDEHFRFPDLGGSLQRIGNLHFRNFFRHSFAWDFVAKIHCRDPVTNDILATMTVKLEKHHRVCIPALIPRHLIQPFMRDWYRMSLYPGDSIKITFPRITGTYDMESDEYKNFEGIEDHCVSAMVPGDPTHTILYRRPYGNGFIESLVPIRFLIPKDSVNIEYDKASETLSIGYPKSTTHAQVMIIKYIWKYNCPTFMNRSINASVSVSLVPYVSCTFTPHRNVQIVSQGNALDVERDPV